MMWMDHQINKIMSYLHPMAMQYQRINLQIIKRKMESGLQQVLLLYMNQLVMPSRVPNKTQSGKGLKIVGPKKFVDSNGLLKRLEVQLFS